MRRQARALMRKWHIGRSEWYSALVAGMLLLLARLFFGKWRRHLGKTDCELGGAIILMKYERKQL